MRNPGGRPKGTERFNIAPMRRAFAADVAPHAPELLQRAVELALGGDSVALAALLGLIGSAMHPKANFDTVAKEPRA